MIITFLIIGCVVAVAAGYVAHSGMPALSFEEPLPKWAWVILFCAAVGFVKGLML